MDKRSYRRAMEIELFRFAFCITIILVHAEYVIGENLLFPGASFGVEFFFLVSGYLMMAGIEKISGTKTDNVGVETLLYLKKKFGSILPELVVADIIGIAFLWICKEIQLDTIGEFLSDAFFEVTMLQRLGLGVNRINVVVWYIQSMFLCMAILFPLIRKYPKIMKTIVMPLVALALLGYLDTKYGHLRSPSKWIGWTYKGNLRAMGELCLGAECYLVTNRIKSLRLNQRGKILLTFVKWACWVSIFVYMWNIQCDKDLLMLAVMCVAVSLAFSGQCVDVGVYNNKAVAFLGKFSLPLYLSHSFYCKHISKILPDGMRYRYMLLCYIVCSLVTALLVMYLAGVIRKNLPSLKAAMQRCFLVQ